MIHSAIPSAPGSAIERRARTRRATTLSAVVGGHLLLLALLLSTRPPVAPPQVGGSLQTFVVSEKRGAPAAPSAAEPRETPAPEPKPSPIVLPTPPLPPGGAQTSGTTAGTGVIEGGCAVAAMLGRAIETDPAALAALLALPPEARTTADAVLVWNGTWLPAPLADGTDSLNGIRQIIEQSFAASPPECVEATIAGPQFIPVAADNRTIMLVVGTGSWRWKDLVEPNMYENEAAPDVQ